MIRERHLRLLTPEFLKLVHGSLANHGKLFLQSDSKAYWEYLVPCVSQLMGLDRTTWTVGGRLERKVTSRTDRNRKGIQNLSRIRSEKSDSYQR